MRPILFIPVWAFALFGYYRSACLESNRIPLLEIPEGFLLLFLKISVFTLSVGAVNIFNQIADIKADEINDGFSVFLKSGLSRAVALGAGVFIAGISIAVPLFLKWQYVYLFSIAAIFIGVIYSFRPTYFTGRPVLDFLSNAIGFGLVAFGVGWVLGGEISVTLFKESLSYILLMCAGSISSTLPDIKGDKLGGKQTTAVLLGKRKAHVLATLFIIFAGLYSFVNSDSVALTAAIISLPVYLLYLLIEKESFMEATYKVGGGMLMVIAAVMYPLFVPFSIIALLLTVLYFRLRFKVTYPSLLPVKEINEN